MGNKSDTAEDKEDKQDKEYKDMRQDLTRQVEFDIVSLVAIIKKLIQYKQLNVLMSMKLLINMIGVKIK